MSIATASFCFSAPWLVIQAVQTIAETRRQRLQMLTEQYGSLAALNEKLGLARTDATLSQIKNKSAHHKTGKPRSMGDDLARKIEAAFDLPEGWMDTPPSYAELHGEPDPMTMAMELMQAMEPEARYQAVRLLDALAQPPKANGTHGQH
jgi:hypothetical protein